MANHLIRDRGNPAVVVGTAELTIEKYCGANWYRCRDAGGRLLNDGAVVRGLDAARRVVLTGKQEG